MNTMLASLIFTAIFLIVQGVPMKKKVYPIPKDCTLDSGSTECKKVYTCGSADYNWKFTAISYCPTRAKSKCHAGPLTRFCDKYDICPCTDHKGKNYTNGEKFMYGETKGSGPLFECKCRRMKHQCQYADCEEIFRLPAYKDPRPPPVFPPFPPFPMPGGFGR